ncbi:UDP-N-acetylmuramate dehydrogenase [Microbacterium sp.]|uniref:UDP-N-acetylmuramate dehydrogenase n=1 Tax=Microbacterium sp. TaxID=51671 RepID=UPI0025F9ECC3|nr:UDP-N-acetylmuramate dehydrogenase [Microbacterium sp.]
MREVSPRPLAELTTLRVGGTPARMLEATTREELIAAMTQIWADREPWLVIGGGSNLLVGDDPFDGTAVLVRSRGIARIPSDREDRVRLRVQAGHDWDDLVAHTVTAGLRGIEAMSGIPGTVGAAPIQNIGAYGQEIVETLVEVELLDEDTGEVEIVPAAELELGFRTSVLKAHYGHGARRRGVIISVTLELADVGQVDIPVGGLQLRNALGLTAEDEVSLGWIRETVLATRARKGMVLDDSDPDTFSAGSFFQNAVVSASFARTLPDACPRWPLQVELDAVQVIPLESYAGLVTPPLSEQPDVKVSAAWLIEHAGLRKGFRLPHSRAGLSTKHALALTNRGGATAAEVAELARYVQLRVQSEFGLLLQPEPILIGVEL